MQSTEGALLDRPIERDADDALDRLPFVDSLIRAVVRDELDNDGRLVARRSRGYVIGLTGSWGLGKSSVLNLLHQKLDSMDRVTVALFNPWLFNGRDELLGGFFSVLRDAMGRSIGEHANGMVGALDRYWGAINLAAHATAAFADAHGAGGAATTGWTNWKDRLRGAIKKPDVATPQDERRKLEKKLKASNSAVVVLVDELDRVEDDEVRAVAQLIKAVGDIKGISYLVAYDPARVTEALGRGDKDRGAAYLEKIVQHPIPLRPLFDRDVEILLKAALEGNGLNLGDPDERYKADIIRELTGLIATPRDVKRLVGAFAVLESAVRGEVSEYDVLAYAWLATKAPKIRAAIAAHPDAVVDDPGDNIGLERLARRLDKKNPQSLSEALGEDVGQLDRLLKLLFPSFSNSHAEAPDRIARRRNLVRLLYLGNPPDMVPRSEVERIWSLPDQGSMHMALIELKNAGRLRGFLDRADDLLAELDPQHDAIFWPALARLLIRPTDWISGPDELRALAEDARDSLVQMGLRDRRQSHRLGSIMDALIDDGDLVLIPAILRKQMFANGLTRHSPSERDGGVLTKVETEAFIERELPRYRAAITDGTALRRLPNLEAVFVIANRSEWDADLRAEFTQQLQGPEALSTFAALIVPPGYGTEKSTLDELSDSSLIADRLKQLKASGDWPEEAYLDGCLRRLRAAARGNSFHDDDDEDDGQEGGGA
ncbi:MAG TPA: P-loop NTPase fold protein [Allosphingosinicella sp.]|nr:P-loop NTPase fold protein [Allosphingosinicella sp.]